MSAFSLAHKESRPRPVDGVMRIGIAGITLEVSWHDPVVLDPLPPVYRQFISGGTSSAGGCTFPVTISLGRMPDTTGMEEVFDTAQSWRLLTRNDEYFLVLNPSGRPGETRWLMRFNREFDRATVYCGDMLVRRIKGAVRTSNPVCYPLDQLMFMYLLSLRQGAVVHAAGLGLRGEGFIFAGRSGAGKSTMSRLLTGNRDVTMLSDDRVIIRHLNEGFRVYGTPWAGEAGVAENRCLPLRGIVFIVQATEHVMKGIAPAEAMKRLMPVVSIPWYDRQVMERVLSFCEALVRNIPAYELNFRPDDGVCDVFQKTVGC